MLRMLVFNRDGGVAPTAYPPFTPKDYTFHSLNQLIPAPLTALHTSPTTPRLTRLYSWQLSAFRHP